MNVKKDHKSDNPKTNKYADMGIPMCSKGDIVYAIVKNSSTFDLEVVEATVTMVDDYEIQIEKPYSCFITNVYKYPLSEWGESIFLTQGETKNKLVQYN